MSISLLHNHTDYSPLDGFSHPEEYIIKASELGLNAFAITEHGNQYSWIYFDELRNSYKNKIKELEDELKKPEIPKEKINEINNQLQKYKRYLAVKMIYGVELYECFDINIKDSDSKYFHLIALAKNEKGRIALNEIITISNFEGFYYKPRIDLEHLKPYANDIIVSSACLASKLARESNYNLCVKYVEEYKSIFPHFYLEMQSHDTIDQTVYNQKILKLSKDTNTPFIITTDSHAADKQDLLYQGYHVQIAHDADTMNEAYNGCYLQSEEEIHTIMDTQIGKDNVNIGLKNTNVIAELIEEVHMPFQKPTLPTYPLPKGYSSNEEFLRHLCYEGWKKRNIESTHSHEIDKCKERLEYELSVIHQMGFDGYFLIVWDFINWSKKNGVMVGDGRGSGAGSLVCYLSGITNIDPIKYDLIFQRFLNPERVSMPDIDVDFSDRDKVIGYLTNKYEIDRVCQIINFSYITPIVAIKDVGKVLKIPYNICDTISKKFVYETFEECMKNNPNLLTEFPQYEEWFKIAGKLSGRVRQVSIHAGGVGIVDTKITNYMGMKLGSKNEHVIQVDKKKIEEIGIIKFDLLGVVTLNLIHEVIKGAGLSLWDIDINNPSFENDKDAYDLLCSTKTNGVFQVESAGMKDLLLRLQPRNLEELSALIALYRPDSMAFIDPYINAKHGKIEINYAHSDIIPVLNKTYGCMIYQEQLLDIVRIFGGRTYGGADKFRKGIGKKDKKIIRAEADKLYKEILENNYGEKIAKDVSEEMSTKGGYLFNKSHSTGYATMCLQTAYLKKHYPVHFMTALLNINKDDYGTLNKYIMEAIDMGIKIIPPSVNNSDSNFTVYKDSILFGLQAIKGVGEKVTSLILENRKEHGKFKDFNDFKSRISPSDSQIITLVKAGAIPTKNKKQFLINYAKKTYERKDYKEVKTVPTLNKLRDLDIDVDIVKDKEERLKLYNQKRKEIYEVESREKFNTHMNNFVDKYLQNEEMWEFEALSIFLKDNPFKDIYDYVKPFDKVQDGGEAVVVGVVSNIVKKKDRNKKQFAYITMYSAFGTIEITCWASGYAKYQNLIKKGNKLAILCSKKEDKAFADSIKTYEQWERGVKKTLKDVI